ncbi:MAG: hypothetical protein BWY68_00672 [bacterium ADurb.Bin400]|nr:MAG: hypothetical protein BWY68_00672 [bacterium ADurb.Bin400]
MLEVNIEKIMPVADAQPVLSNLVDEVNSSDELYVLTSNNKPSAVIVGVHHLEKLTGMSHEALTTVAVTPTDQPTQIENNQPDTAISQPVEPTYQNTPTITAEEAGQPQNTIPVSSPAPTTEPVASTFSEPSTPVAPQIINTPTAPLTNTATEPVSDSVQPEFTYTAPVNQSNPNQFVTPAAGDLASQDTNTPTGQASQ